MKRRCVKKIRLCECECSNRFLNAAHFHKDDVLSRCAYFKQYVLKSTQNKQCIDEMNATCNIKYNVFNKTISDPDPLIEDG